jgi:hypothetical protein
MADTRSMIYVERYPGCGGPADHPDEDTPILAERSRILDLFHQAGIEVGDVGGVCGDTEASIYYYSGDRVYMLTITDDTAEPWEDA